MYLRFLALCATLLTALFTAWPTPAATATDASYETQLERLRQKMQVLKAEIDRDKAIRDETREFLGRIEREIGDINAKLRTLQTELNHRRRRVQQLDTERAHQQQRLADQTDIFSRMVYATYIVGRRGYIKMLLNQEDPARLGRAVTYYRYFARARTRQIEAINQSLNTLRELQGRLDGEHRQLLALEKTQLQHRQALQERRHQRRLILAKLNTRIRSQSEELASLRRDERRLERLLHKLAEMMRELPPVLKEEARFSDMKGRLTLPVQGTIGARFNQHKKGNLRWQGLFLKAPEDQVVRAVFHGRVAFADWLRGFGLLLILDHGEGYMSLYSHNKLLYKEVGDWVATGDAIAVVGNSGGINQTGLYFEIRHNGKPHNPLLWCKAD